MSQAHAAGLAVFLEVAWSLFDGASLVFDASCQDLPGPFLHAEEHSRPDVRYRVRWGPFGPAGPVVRHVLRRWREEAGVDAVVWTDTGCTISAGMRCRRGLGARDLAGEQFLRELAGTAGIPVIADRRFPRMEGVFPAVFDDSLYLFPRFHE